MYVYAYAKLSNFVRYNFRVTASSVIIVLLKKLFDAVPSPH